MIMLGIVNGGLGWQLTGTTAAYVPYAVVAAIVFLIYISVLLFAWYRARATRNLEDEKLNQRGGYEMQDPRQPRHARLGSDSAAHGYPQHAYAEQQTRKQPGVVASYR